MRVLTRRDAASSMASLAKEQRILCRYAGDDDLWHERPSGSIRRGAEWVIVAVYTEDLEKRTIFGGVRVFGCLSF